MLLEHKEESLLHQRAFSLTILGYHPPHRNQIQSELKRLYDLHFGRMKQSLVNVSALALTTDFWSDRKNNCFMCLTGHWIDKEMNMQSSILHFQTYDDRHLASKIGAEVKVRLRDLGIEEKISSITTDGGSNVRAAVETVCKFNRLWCVAHRFHLVICNGLYLWKKFRKNDDDHGMDADVLERGSVIHSNAPNFSNDQSMETSDQHESKHSNSSRSLSENFVCSYRR